MGIFMRYADKIVGAATWTASKTLGSAPARMITGGVVGGALAYNASESNLGERKFQDSLVGIAAGTGLGFLTSKMGASLAFGAGKQALKAGWGGAKMGGRGLGRVGEFALNHPYATTGLALGGLGLYGLASSGPGQGGQSLSQMSATAERNNVASTGFDPGMGYSRQQMARNMFMNSTDGLTLSLHNRRH